MKYRLLILLTGLLLSVQAEAATLEGRVLNIISGDRIKIIATNQRSYTIRLKGIQSPPIRLAAGQIAKRHLAMLIAGKALRVEYKKIDRKGVLLGTILHGGSDMNLRQVVDGMARALPDMLSAKRGAAYQAAEVSARRRALGIWRLAGAKRG